VAPKLSFHLKVLRDAGLIDQDKKKNYYLTPAGKNVAKALKNVTHTNLLNQKVKN
jgi:Mn-dependent DtxR family transcriptional regulator